VHLENGSTGETRDMSTCGLFFKTEQAHSNGETIRLSVSIDNHTVQCEGRVVRVEQLEGRFGIAVNLTFYRFS
jgi:hypothetical protein